MSLVNLLYLLDEVFAVNLARILACLIRVKLNLDSISLYLSIARLYGIVSILVSLLIALVHESRESCVVSHLTKVLLLSNLLSVREEVVRV